MQVDAKHLELAAIEEGLSALDHQITQAALRYVCIVMTHMITNMPNTSIAGLKWTASKGSDDA